MKKAVIVYKQKSDRALKLRDELLELLESEGVECVCLKAGSENLPDHASKCDAIFVIGGDGTFLSTVDAAVSFDLPVVGINAGSLGFLTEISPEEMEEAVREFLEGQCEVEERRLIKAVHIREGKTVIEKDVLNDAVITKTSIARLMEMELSVGEYMAAKVRADGIIISTPTGSTAYSLASGGPVVHPEVRAHVITAICPHSLTVRPMVIPDKFQVEVKILSASGDDGAFLTLDGQTGSNMKEGDVLIASVSDRRLKLVKRKERNYFEILRKKLSWSGP